MEWTTTAMYNNMDVFQMHYFKWEKPDWKGNVPHDLIYIGEKAKSYKMTSVFAMNRRLGKGWQIGKKKFRDRTVLYIDFFKCYTTVWFANIHKTERISLQHDFKNKWNGKNLKPIP